MLARNGVEATWGTGQPRPNPIAVVAPFVDLGHNPAGTQSGLARLGAMDPGLGRESRGLGAERRIFHGPRSVNLFQ